MFKCTNGALRYRRDYRKRQKKVKKKFIFMAGCTVKQGSYVSKLSRHHHLAEDSRVIIFGPRKDENRRSGRPRQTTAGQDRRLRLLAVRDRFSTTRSIADQWFGEEGRRITTRTI
jgi:hypothetical protein